MFADKLRALRREFKLKQEDLAEKLGVHVNTISRWERGDGSPKMSDIQEMADKLGLPTSFFVDAAETDPGSINDFTLVPYARIRDRARKDGRRMKWSNRDEALVLLTRAMEELLGGDIKVLQPVTRDEIETMRTALYDHKSELPFEEYRDESFIFEVEPYAEAYDLARRHAKRTTARQKEMAFQMLRYAAHEMFADLQEKYPEVVKGWE